MKHQTFDDLCWSSLSCCLTNLIILSIRFIRHYVILESLLCHLYDYIFLRLQSFEILPRKDTLSFLIDNFSYTMYIYDFFFFNIDKFFVQRSEPGGLRFSTL